MMRFEAHRTARRPSGLASAAFDAGERPATRARKFRKIASPVAGRFLRVELRRRTRGRARPRSRTSRARRRRRRCGIADRRCVRVREVRLRCPAEPPRASSTRERRVTAFQPTCGTFTPRRPEPASSRRSSSPARADGRRPRAPPDHGDRALRCCLRTAIAGRDRCRGADGLRRNWRRIASRHGSSSTAVASKCPTPGTMIPSAVAMSAGASGVNTSAPTARSALRTDVRLPAR